MPAPYFTLPSQLQYMLTSGAVKHDYIFPKTLGFNGLQNFIFSFLPASIGPPKSTKPRNTLRSAGRASLTSLHILGMLSSVTDLKSVKKKRRKQEETEEAFPKRLFHGIRALLLMTSCRHQKDRWAYGYSIFL